MSNPYDRLLLLALDEDVGGGDLTATAVLDPALRARGLLRVREAGVISGIDAALRVFELLDPSSRIRVVAPEGSAVEPGATVGEVVAPARVVVTGERLALNLFGRMSGIATLTREFVRAVAGTSAAIVDTRKTTPLLRRLEKAAVKAGGGVNHRFGLFDAVLVKDNHLDLAGAAGSTEGVARVTRAARAGTPAGTFVQIEARTVEEALAAAAAGADSVLFDNFTPADLLGAVATVRAAVRPRSIVLEASGGVNLKTVRAFAEAGVDRISIGALTHAARSLDITMDIERLPAGG